jgi:adenosine deaminase
MQDQASRPKASPKKGPQNSPPTKELKKARENAPEPLVEELTQALIEIISETNGIALDDTLELLMNSDRIQKNESLRSELQDFRELISAYQTDQIGIETLLHHTVASALFEFFRRFPLPYRDEHTHLTGALSAEFVYPRIKKLLAGPNKAIYEKKITDIYGPSALPIGNIEDVERLLKIKDDERFSRYLSILMLPKLLLVDRQAHTDAAYHMAKTLYGHYNVGFIRLKFSYSRATTDESEKVPGLEDVTEEDVVLGLYDGFMKFKREYPQWNFTLSPSFRKESNFYDNVNFKSKKEHFLHQVNGILALIAKHPELRDVMNEVDTVGNEAELYRKSHFVDMKLGFRKLQYRGFKIRSHHGEVWKTLRKGIQAVDNAMNIWRIDTLEHGLSLGINPNYYFHSLYQRVIKWNTRNEAIRPGTLEFNEVTEMDWQDHSLSVRDKLINGEILNSDELRLFTKAKFHTAREVELYQHDVLNRMIDKGVSLVSLPSSNNKLSALFEDYKDHPFSWWEKKNLELGIGTDNYVTLDTNYIQEQLILLFTDPYDLKITKLLMVSTGETRRPYISHFLWEMRRPHQGE